LRIALAEGAKILNIPVVTLPTKGIGLQDIIAGLYTSNTGKSLTTFETALVCKRLAAFGWTETQIGKKLGFGPEYIEQLLEVVSAPMTIVTMIQNGECSVGLALDMLRKHRGGAVDVLKTGLENAQRAGKKSVTKSFIAGASLEKVVKKQAKPLYDAAKKIVQDPGFQGLSQENRELVEKLLAEINTKEKAAEERVKAQEAKIAGGSLETETQQAS
jgi:ParB-like chromosome segregation protein Spo0J